MLAENFVSVLLIATATDADLTLGIEVAAERNEFLTYCLHENIISNVKRLPF